MGAEACSPERRPLLSKTHTSGPSGSLWTPGLSAELSKQQLRVLREHLRHSDS